MRKLIKNIFWAGLLVLMPTQFAQAFSIIGPAIGGGSGGDAWEQPIIGYGLPGDVGTPKNLAEEYRRVTPVMYYASDATFINYFGMAGLTNIDSAAAMMNGVMCGQTNMLLFLSSPTNGILSGNINDPYTGSPLAVSATNTLDSYTINLADFPLESQQINYTAQAAGLTDLRSSTLMLLVEQMGLAEPERYAWTLHDRFLPSGGTCPRDELYLVVQRNFDIIDSPLNQVQYSPYINGTLYTYDILEVCTGSGELAVTIPLVVDIFADSYTSVASFFLFDGGFYNGLTRDDVAGLRYLMSSNNVNFEATAPSGSLLLQTNVQPPQLFTTFPLSALSILPTLPPDQVLSNFPGITIFGVNTNFINQVVTNYGVPYYVYLSPPYTNPPSVLSNGMAIYPTNGIIPFTNWSTIQYGDPPLVTNTYSLANFSLVSPFMSPTVLTNNYPGISWNSESSTFVIITNLIPYYTNQSVLPVFSNTLAGGLPNVTVLTNIYYFTNQPGPTVINYDITQPFTTISTLDLANFIDAAKTNDPATLLQLYPGLQILRSTTFPGFTWVTNYVSYLTNYTGAPYQGPPKLVTLPVSTNYIWVTNWTYSFGNVFTNHFYTNRFITVQSIWITNNIGAPYGSPLIAKTNSVTFKTNLISGDFFLIPTNWCGFDLRLSFPLGNPPYKNGVTNTTIFAGYNTSGSVGTNFTIGGNAYGLIQNVFDQYTNYNYAVYPGICEPVLTYSAVTNVVLQYSYVFNNIFTNHFYSNSPVSVIITNAYSTALGSPDVLSFAGSTNFYYTNIQSGDFLIIPSTWCGFQIIPLETNLSYTTNVSLVTTQNSSGNLLTYYQQTVLPYTNYLMQIRPGICEPQLAFTNSVLTNIVSQYSYNFGGSIHTNTFITNYPTVITITNTTEILNSSNALIGYPLQYVVQSIPVYRTYVNCFFGPCFTNTFFDHFVYPTNFFLGNITNYVTYVTNYGSIGDFYIVPPQWCDLTILSTQLQTIGINQTTIGASDPLYNNILGQLNYTTTTNTPYLVTTLLIKPVICASVPATPALRQGIGRVQMIRANYDSLLGQFFQPLTNYYTMVRITNSQPVTEFYQRVITQPDLLIRAQDLASGPSAAPVVGSVARNLNFDQSQILTSLAGPGTIIPRTSFTYNKVGNIYANGSQRFFFTSTNAFLNEVTGGNFFGASNQLSVLAWASFDSSTNQPVVYPNGTSIADVINQLFIQVTPTTVSDATVGTAYTPVTFTATGGQPPYVWSAPNLEGLVPGMTFNAATATLSGTPTATGAFNFTVQVTDLANRTVSMNYTIIIH